MRTTSLFPEPSQDATAASPFDSDPNESETPRLSDERACEFGRMIACHLAAGRFGVAHNTIDWATREANSADNPVAVSSPLAALELPMRVNELFERHDVTYIFQLFEWTPQQIMAWPQSGPRTMRLIRKALRRHGISIWK